MTLCDTYNFMYNKLNYDTERTNHQTSKTLNSLPSMTSKSKLHTSPKCDMQSCLIKKSNNVPLTAAVIVLSIIAAILTTAVIIIPLIIIATYKRKFLCAINVSIFNYLMFKCHVTFFRINIV